jgi:hypothetical protein
VLYLRMIESALRHGLDPDAVVERFGYFFPSIRARGLRVDWQADTLEEGMLVLQRLCGGIAAGAFLATDDKQDCRFCDYRSICDVDRVTRHSKQLLDRDDLLEREELLPLENLWRLRRGQS